MASLRAAARWGLVSMGLSGALERAAQEHGRLRILDIGCGSGKALLAQYGEVHGIDYSVGSLAQNRGIYKQVMQCDATMVPYPDCHFDFILSDNVLGHVPFDRKEALID